ncbi:protein naked cuticle homolog 2-like [Corticium candelabrum]|uniref:protein naked cuticle homolog 2-like n=1 Tax=Corticium candelabrum TaxID=121492 RepID=UPI002E26E94C|nr:protein naked cuticle homolog 2-like [Corticium candelabrum]
MCKQELQSPSKNEEQAGSMAVRGNQIEKRRKKESHKKRLSHSGRGLVKCEELSCSVSVRSKQIPSGGHKLQWVFKLYDMESSRSLDEREVPTLMKSVCDMLSAQVERSRVPPAHKRFKVRLNIMQHQSRLKPVRSSNSRFVLRKMRKSETVTCHSHGDECTSCATYAASDEQSLCLTERRLRQVENKESELRDDDLRKQISVRQRRRIGHGNGSSSNPELRSRCHQKSSRRRSLNGDQSRDNSQSASKKTGNKHDRRRSSLPSNSLPGVSTDEVVVQTTKKQFPLASPVKLRHQGRGGSKRHSCHAAFIAENICHRKSEVMSEKLYEKVQTVTKQEVVPSSDSSESVVHHHHHHEHHHHHYHVYHQL